jgi:histidinol-phosphatase (PHP family)
MRVDLHNHTTLCHHATGTMEEYVQQAIKLGIDIFGFSCHAPMDFEQEYRMSLSQSKIYKENIFSLKEKYKDKIKILYGFEVDYMENKDFIEKDILSDVDIDYLIGSVHFVNKWGFDNPQFLANYESKNIDTLWEEYFATVLDMVKTGLFDIVGHLDLIKIFKYLPTKNIVDIAYDTMKAIKQSGMVLEINSAGFRKPIGEQYPSRELLEIAFEMDINITFGSDAHKIEQISFKYDEVRNLAKNIGFNKCVSFRNRDKILIDF